ncbi:hypothetical protein JKY79_00100 [Candidatus Babeliales bacterium]|nr:hypothetical protein [Candidatus Babeliales bacterium]
MLFLKNINKIVLTIFFCIGFISTSIDAAIKKYSEKEVIAYLIKTDPEFAKSAYTLSYSQKYLSDSWISHAPYISKWYKKISTDYERMLVNDNFDIFKSIEKLSFKKAAENLTEKETDQIKQLFLDPQTDPKSKHSLTESLLNDHEKQNKSTSYWTTTKLLTWSATKTVLNTTKNESVKQASEVYSTFKAVTKSGQSILQLPCETEGNAKKKQKILKTKELPLSPSLITFTAWLFNRLDVILENLEPKEGNLLSEKKRDAYDKFKKLRDKIYLLAPINKDMAPGDYLNENEIALLVSKLSGGNQLSIARSNIAKNMAPQIVRYCTKSPMAEAGTEVVADLTAGVINGLTIADHGKSSPSTYIAAVTSGAAVASVATATAMNIMKKTSPETYKKMELAVKSIVDPLIEKLHPSIKENKAKISILVTFFVFQCFFNPGILPENMPYLPNWFTALIMTTIQSLNYSETAQEWIKDKASNVSLPSWLNDKSGNSILPERIMDVNHAYTNDLTSLYNFYRLSGGSTAASYAWTIGSTITSWTWALANLHISTQVGAIVPVGFAVYKSWDWIKNIWHRNNPAYRPSGMNEVEINRYNEQKDNYLPFLQNLTNDAWSYTGQAYMNRLDNMYIKQYKQ